LRDVDIGYMPSIGAKTDVELMAFGSDDSELRKPIFKEVRT